jgi:hypothetical protein
MPEYKGYTITRSDREGKKYKAIDEQGNEIHFGASGYRIKPGTDAGNSYCARSAGIDSKKGGANWWARQLWSCEGNKSVNEKPFFGLVDLP